VREGISAVGLGLNLHRKLSLPEGKFKHGAVGFDRAQWKAGGENFEAIADTVAEM